MATLSHKVIIAKNQERGVKDYLPSLSVSHVQQGYRFLLASPYRTEKIMIVSKLTSQTLPLSVIGQSKT